MDILIGSTSIANKVKIDGLAWSEEDLHSAESGRTMDGIMHIYRIGTKVSLDITCKPMTLEDAQKVLQAVRSSPEFSVTYTDPAIGERTAKFYCSNRNCEFLMAVGVKSWWQNIKFKLIEC